MLRKGNAKLAPIFQDVLIAVQKDAQNVLTDSSFLRENVNYAPTLSLIVGIAMKLSVLDANLITTYK